MGNLALKAAPNVRRVAPRLIRGRGFWAGLGSMAGTVAQTALQFFFSIPVRQILTFIAKGGLYFVVAAGAAGVYLLYRLYRKAFHNLETPVKDPSDQTIKEIAENIPENNVDDIPEWIKLQPTPQEMKKVEKISLECLKEKIATYTCPITHEVTREPAQVPCCSAYFEKSKIIPVLTRDQKCPCCRQKITCKDLLTGRFEREDAIMALRLQIRKAYECLETEEDKKNWREVIEGGMGKNYEI